VKGFALAVAALFVALAVRSVVHWVRHHPVLHDTKDELLFAAFVTGRVGTWVVAAAMFAVFGSISTVGQPYRDEASGYGWLFMVFLALGAMQFLASWFLGARDRGEAGDEPRPPGV
jgi:hypothetical protein